MCIFYSSKKKSNPNSRIIGLVKNVLKKLKFYQNIFLPIFTLFLYDDQYWMEFLFQRH